MQKSRFSHLIPDANDAEADQNLSQLNESGSPETVKPKRLPKNKDPEFQRTTVYLPKSLLKQIKIAAAQEELDASELIAKATQEWINAREN